MKTQKVNRFESFVGQAFGEDGLLARNLPGYMEREGQVEIAKKIESHVVGDRGILFAEGPTGVGKSIAALVPAFELLRQRPEGFVVVVTSSILLQEQYLNKDIPFLENLFDFPVEATLLKGKRNYLCNYKLKETQMSKDPSTVSNSPQHAKIQAWATQTQTGDMNELDFNPSYETWKDYSIVEDGECNGKQCPAFKECFYYSNRAKSKKSRIIVCNYHYYLLAVQSEGMLPGVPMMAIFDEAHEVAMITRDFQELTLSPQSFMNTANALMNAAKRADNENGGAMEHFVKSLGFGELQNVLTQESEALFHLKKGYVQGEALTLDFENIDQFKASMQRMGKQIEMRYKDMRDLQVSLASYVENYGVENWSDAEKKWYNVVNQMTELLKNRAIMLFHSMTSPQDAEYLSWLQPIRDKRLVSIHRKPFSARRLAEQVLFSQPSVFISATLSIEGSFGYYRRELGAPKNITQEIIVDSPFKLDENLLWYLPEDCPEGSGNAHHIDYVLDEMEHIAKRLGGRTMMLFTSRKNMLAGIARMEKAFENDDVLVLNQHDHPKDRIITTMRQQSNVVVIGTKSFFTGVDVPGKNLSAVLIDKMPFPMNGDPVNNYLMEQPNGFRVFTLPETIITSKQAVGRLNRTVDDVGIIAVFDGRLRTKSYKRRFFRSFGFTIQGAATKDELERFVKEKIEL